MNSCSNKVSPEVERHERITDEREAILDSLGDIFYIGSTHLVGMAELLGQMGVARKTFYRAFASKEELITAYLDRRHRVAKAELAGVVKGLSGTAAIEAVFDSLEVKSASARFRGCAFHIAAIENPTSEKVKKLAEENRAFLKTFFTGLLEGVPHCEETADQVLLLYQGALSISAVSNGEVAVRSAKRMLSLLLGEATGNPTR